jgi:hypothetical protein
VILLIAQTAAANRSLTGITSTRRITVMVAGSMAGNPSKRSKNENLIVCRDDHDPPGGWTSLTGDGRWAESFGQQHAWWRVDGIRHYLSDCDNAVPRRTSDREQHPAAA